MDLLLLPAQLHGMLHLPSLGILRSQIQYSRSGKAHNKLRFNLIVFRTQNILVTHQTATHLRYTSYIICMRTIKATVVNALVGCLVNIKGNTRALNINFKQRLQTRTLSFIMNFLMLKLMVQQTGN